MDQPKIERMLRLMQVMANNSNVALHDNVLDG